MATSRPNSGDTATLLISCPDHRGIVAEVTHFIFTYNGNILHSDQHNDDETGTFFMRIEWDLVDFSIKKDKIHQAFEAIAEKFQMEWRLEFSTRVTRTAIFCIKVRSLSLGHYDPVEIGRT